MTSALHILVVGAASNQVGAAHYTSLIQAAELVIAADAGLELCLAADRVPEVCVGDFDSVAPDALQRAEQGGADIRRFPAMKDESDLDLAVRIARDLGAARLTFTAAFTGRLDHTLAALGTVLGAADLHAEVAEPLWRGYALSATGRDKLVLTEPAGTVLSLMAPSGATISIEGVLYPLHTEMLPALSSRGLSNVATESPQRVTLLAGAALVLVNAR